MGEPVEYGAKFSYIKEFFTFYESNRKPNGKYQLVFLCVNCQPLVKVVKTDSDSPLSNLRQHLTNYHQDYVPQFRNLFGTRNRRPKKSSTKETSLDR